MSEQPHPEHAEQPEQPEQPEQLIRVTAYDPTTGENHTSELEPNGYVLICGEHMELTYEQRFPGSGTVQLTIRRKDRRG